MESVERFTVPLYSDSNDVPLQGTFIIAVTYEHTLTYTTYTQHESQTKEDVLERIIDTLVNCEMLYAKNVYVYTPESKATEVYDKLAMVLRPRGTRITTVAKQRNVRKEYVKLGNLVS